MTTNTVTTVSAEIGGTEISLETGRMAKQAGGAVEPRPAGEPVQRVDERREGHQRGPSSRSEPVREVERPDDRRAHQPASG